jgi:hypothetical protein
MWLPMVATHRMAKEMSEMPKPRMGVSAAGDKMKDRLRYEILNSDGSYTRCTKAEPTSNGWLHYELADGTIGLKKPNTWRTRSSYSQENHTAFNCVPCGTGKCKLPMESKP